LREILKKVRDLWGQCMCARGIKEEKRKKSVGDPEGYKNAGI
jgi:hypothetical protein